MFRKGAKGGERESERIRRIRRKKMSNKKNQLYISEKKLSLFITSLLLFYASFFFRGE